MKEKVQVRIQNAENALLTFRRTLEQAIQADRWQTHRVRGIAWDAVKKAQADIVSMAAGRTIRKPKEPTDVLYLRIPKTLKEQIEVAAKRERQSCNEFVTTLLRIITEDRETQP